ncbi:MAG: hypothetical protein IJH39_01160 [Clostridia bacterium]|nr:hypothetical protein [Clostridia bacterium]
MFLKTVIRQGEKIMQLEEEKQNTDEKVAELTCYQINTEKLHNSIIRDLLNLQDISRLGIAECEKDKHRNIIINRIIKELVDDYQSIN